MHWRRKRQPTPVFLPGESHEQRSLVSCSPWGHRETMGSSCRTRHTPETLITQCHVCPRIHPSHRHFLPRLMQSPSVKCGLTDFTPDFLTQSLHNSKSTKKMDPTSNPPMASPWSSKSSLWLQLSRPQHDTARSQGCLSLALLMGL